MEIDYISSGSRGINYIGLKLRVRLGSRKTGLTPHKYFNTDCSKAVLLLRFLTGT